MEQGSKLWHKARTGKITGSRIAVMLCLSPFKTRKNLMRDMVRQHHGLHAEFKGNIATQWGTVHESQACSEYEGVSGNIVKHEGIVKHPTVPFITYSPDGWFDDSLIEIKCPFNQKMPDEVPRYYWVQVQLGMEVMDKSECVFIYWTPDHIKTFIVKRDKEWFSEVLPEIELFHKEYLEELDNPLHLQELERDDKAWEEAAISFIAAKKDLDEAKEREAAAKKVLIELSPELSVKGCGVTFSVVDSKGSVKYKDIPELQGVDLEAYRGEGTTRSYRIVLTK